MWQVACWWQGVQEEVWEVVATHAVVWQLHQVKSEKE